MDFKFGGGKPAAPGQGGAAPKKGTISLDLFGSKPKVAAVDTVGINSQLNNLSMRMRVIEERYTNMRRKTQLIEQNMLAGSKRSKDELKLLEEDITDLKRKILELNSKTNQIILELRNCAMKQDVEMLRKYIDIWQPVNFVTINQAEKMINDAVEDIKTKK